MSTFVTFIVLLCVLNGCVHHIHVSPSPATSASTTIPRALQLAIGPPMLEGADHMPGITLLDWPQRDLRQAVIRYLDQRGTFESVSADEGELSLHIATKLALASRQNRYRYRIRLQAEMKEGEGLIKSYRVEHEAVGSSVRWVTASDREPIETALQAALDDLLSRIESDRPLFLRQERPE